MARDVVAALLAIAAGDRHAAIAHGRAATAHHPDQLLAPALARYLAAGVRDDVYTTPDAFAAFINGGSNVALYDATIADIKEVDQVRAAAQLLDIGCGDGRVTAAVAGDQTRRVDLVEPSAHLLGRAVARFDGRSTAVGAHPCGVLAFLAGRDPAARWDVAQATFALSAIEPAARRRALAQLREGAGTLVLVEFDVPGFADRSPDHARYAAERYERGLHEYRDDDLVIHGFLLPVLVAQFDPARPRLTWEQPAAAWISDVAAAGWSRARSVPVRDYWWAPAELIVAES